MTSPDEGWEPSVRPAPPSSWEDRGGDHWWAENRPISASSLLIL